MESLKKFLDRYPLLARIAYVVFSAIMGLKNVIYWRAYRWFGHVPRRMSDRGQDRWVIDEVFAGRTGGFFVELGAFDGFSESNTFVLEKRYGWRGLAIEPNPVNYRVLTEVTARDCTCVPLAVDPEPGVLEFYLDGQRSSLIVDEADHQDKAADIETARAEGKVVSVETLPLADIFDRYDAPEVIDYFSLDVEGSETRIMRGFPFDRYRFLTLTIERPTPELNEILFANGYHFVRNSLYDTFYVHESLPNFDAIDRRPFEQLPAKQF